MVPETLSGQRPRAIHRQNAKNQTQPAAWLGVRQMQIRGIAFGDQKAALPKWGLTCNDCHTSAGCLLGYTGGAGPT